MFFCGKALKPAFEKENLSEFEEELNRLFRTNAFNISQRERFKQERMRKFPQLKQAPPKESLDQLISRVEQRVKVPK